MSYRYYGGTGSQSPDSILRDMEWKKRHFSHEDWKREGEASKRWTEFVAGVIIVGVFGLFVFGMGALAIWGFQNIVSTPGFEFSLTGFLLNPITILIVGVGGSILASKR